MAVVRSYSVVTAQLGPTAQWRFDETGGGAAVDRVDSLDGTYHGGVTFGQSGATGRNGAVRLDGDGSFVEIQSASGGSFAVELAAFGDSLVAGFGLGASSNFLSARLEAALDARGLDSTVTTFGQNGRTTTQALGAVQSVINSAPDVVISVHGTNDSLNGVAPATVESNLRTMIQQFQAADIEVLLTGTFGLWPNETFNLKGYDTRDPANALKLADQFEAVFPKLADEFGIELFAPYHGGERNGDQIVGGTLGDAGLNQGDGVHPNAAGVSQIAERMAPQALLAAAASGALQAPNEPLLLANGTIEVWFNADDVSARQGLFSKDAQGFGTGGHISAAIQNGHVAVGIEGLTGGAFVQGEVQAHTDTHLAFTFGAGGMRLFIDGVLVDSGGFTGGLDIGVDGLGNFEPLVLGALIDASPNHGIGTPTDSFAGTFDEVAIYDRALSSAEIEELFRAGAAGFKLVGTADDDTLIGGVDRETLRGLAGNDELAGGGGNDRLLGGGGNDRLLGGDGANVLIGGAGSDELRGAAGRDTLSGGPGRDGLFGGSGGDLLRGNNGRDTIRGEDGGDEIFGNKGADTLEGGSGNDLLDGGPGFDILTGGPGADRFVIARLADGVDRITDFQPGAGGDVLDIGSILRGFQPGTSRVADFVRLESSGGDTTVAIDNNGAGNDFVAVAELGGVSGPNLNQLVADGNLGLS
jgi:Ca2+-binding RTX toxin-like protein